MGAKKVRVEFVDGSGQGVGGVTVKATGCSELQTAPNGPGLLPGGRRELRGDGQRCRGIQGHAVGPAREDRVQAGWRQLEGRLIGTCRIRFDERPFGAVFH